MKGWGAELRLKKKFQLWIADSACPSWYPACSNTWSKSLGSTSYIYSSGLFSLVEPRPIEMCFQFLSVQIYPRFPVSSFLTYGSFTSVLFIFQVFGNYPDSFLLLISKLILLWLEDTLCRISVILHLLRLVFWLRMWLILVHSPCVFEKNVYSAGVVWNVLNMTPVFFMAP